MDQITAKSGIQALNDDIMIEGTTRFTISEVVRLSFVSICTPSLLQRGRTVSQIGVTSLFPSHRTPFHQASHSKISQRNLSMTTTSEKGAKWRVLIASVPPPVAVEELGSTQDISVEYPSPEKPLTHAQVLSYLKKSKENSTPIHGCYISSNKFDKEVIEAGLPHLQVISTQSVGFNNIDIESAKEHDIRVGHTPDVLTDTTADSVVLLVLAACRRAKEGLKYAEKGVWDSWNPEFMVGVDVHHAKVGIVGLGRIGSAVARRLHAFGCKILYSSVRGRKGKEKSEAKEFGGELRDFDDLIAEADIIIPTCPLTDESKGLFDKDVFSKMKKTAVFANAARGGLVNQDDLYEALKEERIFAAGLDVATPEPLPKDHKLLTLDNCFITPHIGSASTGTRNEMAKMAADNLINALRKKPMRAAVV